MCEHGHLDHGVFEPGGRCQEGWPAADEVPLLASLCQLRLPLAGLCAEPGCETGLPVCFAGSLPASVSLKAPAASCATSFMCSCAALTSFSPALLPASLTRAPVRMARSA